MGKFVEEVVENHLDVVIGKWFAIYTKYKSEKEVARQLERKGIEVYLPLNRVVRKYTRKTKTVTLPLLHCYLFVKITKKQYVPVLETPNVIKFVKFNQNLVSIKQSEIDILKKVCDHFYHIETTDVNFIKGQPVELIGGGITGIKGYVLEDQGRHFLIELDGIGVGLRIQVEPHMIRALV